MEQKLEQGGVAEKPNPLERLPEDGRMDPGAASSLQATTAEALMAAQGWKEIPLPNLVSAIPSCAARLGDITKCRALIGGDGAIRVSESLPDGGTYTYGFAPDSEDARRVLAFLATLPATAEAQV